MSRHKRKSFSIFIFIVSILLAPASVFAQSQTPPMRFEFHTESFDPTTGKKHPAHYVIDGGDYNNAEEIAAIPKHFIDEHGKSLLPDGHEIPMTIEIVVPKNLDKDRVEEFVAHVVKTFRAQIGEKTKIKIRKSYFNVDLRLLELDTARRQADAEARGLTDPGEKAAVDLLKTTIDEEASRLIQWDRSFKEKITDWPRVAAFSAYVVASIKGTIGFTLTISRFGWGIAEGMVAAVRAAVTAGFGFKAYDFAKWVTEVKWFGSTANPELERYSFVRLFNNNKTFKSIVISLGINFFMNYGTRLTAYLAGFTTHNMQTGTSGPATSPHTLDFALTFAGNSAVELWGDSIKAQGVRTLMQKGILNYTTASMLLYTVSIIDTVYQSFVGMGQNTLATAVNFSNVFICKLGTFVVSRILKPRERRIVVISGLIPREEDKKKYVKSDLNLIIKQLAMENGIKIGPAVELKLRQGEMLDTKAFASATGLTNIPLEQLTLIHKRFYGLVEEASSKGQLIKSCRGILALNPAI